MVRYERQHDKEPDYYIVGLNTDFEFPLHFHRCFELTLVLEGEMQVRREKDKDNFTLKAGDMIFVGNNCMRIDLSMSDPEYREFDICFAGMFRSVDEGCAYAEQYLKTNNIISEDYTKAPETTAAPKTEAPETDPVEVDTNAPTDTGAGNNSTETTGAAGGEGGCSSVIGFGAVVVLVAVAASVALKKKD